MALIQQQKEVKPRLQKKEINIKADTWKQADNYIKYAGIRGTNQEKIEFLVEQALLHIFDADEGFQKFMTKPSMMHETIKADPIKKDGKVHIPDGQRMAK